MRVLLALLVFVPLTGAAEPIVIAKPEAFPTLVNPNCSHCVDEAKRRKDELKDADPVLCWTRGYSDGGAIPQRFFLNKYRVISDSYGVFVHDPDAGYSRGFAASFNFEFHGWRNGVMVMKDKSDGTLFSCLSGAAFDGPRKGERLKPIPTLVSTWGEVMKRNPNAVAYHMFDKYKAVEADAQPNADSAKSRLYAVKMTLPDGELDKGKWKDIGVQYSNPVTVLRMGDTTKALAFRTRLGTKLDLEWTTVGAHKVAVFSNEKSVAAYLPVARQVRKWKAPNPDKSGISPADAGQLLPGEKELPPKAVKLVEKNGVILDEVTESKWGIDGRAYEGPLKGWTLDPVDDYVVCKYFAYVADYREAFKTKAEEPKPAEKEKPIAGTAEFLRLLPKPFGVVKAIDPKARTVSLLLDGEKVAKVWAVEPDAEVKVNGFWGRLDQFKANDRVWVWLKLDRAKNPVSVAMIADEISAADIHDERYTAMLSSADFHGLAGQTRSVKYLITRGKTSRIVTLSELIDLKDRPVLAMGSGREETIVTEERFAEAQKTQKDLLRKVWLADGLPGTLAFHHVFSGELEVMLEHEAIRWGRSLKAGDKVTLTADPPIAAVVKAVTPWRERTQLRLVVGELQSSELKTGQRINVKMTAPPKEVDESPYPPDLGRKRTDDERVEWFLASIYCVCGVGNDICTGHFYTLASCNPNGCGAPNFTRDEIRKLIGAGKTDREIWDELRKDRGELMLRPHLRK